MELLVGALTYGAAMLRVLSIFVGLGGFALLCTGFCGIFASNDAVERFLAFLAWVAGFFLAALGFWMWGP